MNQDQLTLELLKWSTALAAVCVVGIVLVAVIIYKSSKNKQS